VIMTTMTCKISTDNSLLLVSSGLPPASGSLELASLGPDEGLGVGVGSSGSSKMLDGLASLAGSLQKNGVLSSRSSQSKLVKGDDLT